MLTDHLDKPYLIIIIIMEIYAAPKLSKYMTALGAYNVKSFTYDKFSNTCTSTHTHTHTHTHTRTHTRTHTHARVHACSHMHAHTST